MGELDVIARVPQGSKVVGDNDREVIAAGAEFAFRIERCHLSTNFYRNQDTHLFCVEQAPPRFDIGEDFRFHGAVLVRGRGSFRWWCPPEQELSTQFLSSPQNWNLTEEVGGVGMLLPGRWITHVMECNERPGSSAPNWTLLPVPAWQAET